MFGERAARTIKNAAAFEAGVAELAEGLDVDWGVRSYVERGDARIAAYLEAERLKSA